MIALDTNVLVRFLVADDAYQTERATELLVRTLEAGDLCHVSDVVLCELVWVLERTYKLGRTEIRQGLGRLLHAQQLAFSSVERLSRALEAYGQRKGNFADYVIREHAQAAGCTAVATFDGDLLKDPGFISV